MTNNVNEFARRRAMADQGIIDTFEADKRQLQEAAAAKKKKSDEEMHKAVMQNIASPANKRKQLYENAQYLLDYKKHFREVALSEALTEVAMKALPLDKTEYAKINPDFRKQTYDFIRGFIESTNLETAKLSPEAKTILCRIDAAAPAATARLTEDAESVIGQNILKNVPSQLDSLSHNVEGAVATIVAADQAVAQDQQNAIDDAKNAEQSVANLAIAAHNAENGQAGPDPVADGITDVTPADGENLTGAVADQNAALSPLDDPDAAIPHTAGVPETGHIPVDQPIDADNMADVKEIRNLGIAREQYADGIISCLALDNGRKMLAEGKEFNSDLALAEAVQFVTGLESLRKAGLRAEANTNADYQEILERRGISHKPSRASLLRHNRLQALQTGTMTPAKETPSVLSAAVEKAKKEKEAAPVKEAFNFDKVHAALVEAMKTGKKAVLFGPLRESIDVIAKWNANHPDEAIKYEKAKK